MEKKDIWVITPKTNLHVGDENTSSYGLIDKAIQRNAVTELPCINSSSLKGAIKEYAIYKGMQKNDCINVFGSYKGNDDDTKKGQYVFFDAELVAIPVPGKNTAYVLKVCEDAVENFVAKAKLFGMDVTVDEVLSKIGKHEKVNMNEFIALCNDENLPIIARNCLENGESKNLWYEQVLPFESVLLTIIDSKEDNILNAKIENKIIQIGANATIGYGYCKFEHL